MRQHLSSDAGFNSRSECDIQKRIGPEFFHVLFEQLDPSIWLVVISTVIGMPIAAFIIWYINRKRVRPVTTFLVFSMVSFGVMVCFAEGRSDYSFSAIASAVIGALVTGIAMFAIRSRKNARI